VVETRHPLREAAQEALEVCCQSIEAQATEAKSAIRERVKHYPCGRVCEITGHLRIARAQDEIEEVLQAFEDRVAVETREALTQAVEIAVVPSASALADVLARRLAFWEAEIEDSWSHWSAQASVFHDACRGAAEAWQQLRESAEALVEKLADSSCMPPEETPPIVYLVPFLDIRAVQRHRRWDDAHEALVKAAVCVALLGAWTEYHNLRGDGEVLREARDLLYSLLDALDTRFDPARYAGSEAVRSGLAADETWCLTAPLAIEVWNQQRLARQSASPGELHSMGAADHVDAEAPWWSPDAWSLRRPSAKASAAAALAAASAAAAAIAAAASSSSSSLAREGGGSSSAACAAGGVEVVGRR